MNTDRKQGKIVLPFAGKVALITGASAGLGAATATEFACRGAQVILVARCMNRLEAQAQAIRATGGQAVAFQADLAEPSQVEALTAYVTSQHGCVDILIHNVGGGAFVPFNVPGEQVGHMLHANLLGAILLTQALLPAMQERHAGAIISVAAVSGLVAIDPLYSATKFGLRGFTLSLRRALEGSGVSVSVISPGFIRTEANQFMRFPMPTPEQVARRIARLVTHPRREIIVPGYFRLAVWAEQHLPWVIDRISHLFSQGSAMKEADTMTSDGSHERMREPDHLRRQ
jgi:short-subunit dehydrogenase